MNVLSRTIQVFILRLKLSEINCAFSPWQPFRIGNLFCFNLRLTININKLLRNHFLRTVWKSFILHEEFIIFIFFLHFFIIYTLLVSCINSTFTITGIGKRSGRNASLLKNCELLIKIYCNYKIFLFTYI